MLGDERAQPTLRPPPLQPIARPEVAGLLRRDLAHWAREGWGPWTLAERSAEGRILGRGGLARTEVAGGGVELPWAIHPDRWNEGLATEAAQAALQIAWRLGLARVISFTLVGNTASRRVMEKAGLRHVREFSHHELPHALYEAVQAASAPAQDRPPPGR